MDGDVTGDRTNGSGAGAPNGSRPERPPINLALQGGGSHGAYTWGVVDALIERNAFEIAAVSGTSAGAMNLAAMAAGWAEGGPEGARAKLRSFWEAVSRSALLSPIKRTPFDRLVGNWSLRNSPGYWWWDAVSRMFSPYDAPVEFNPLRDVVEAEIDFDAVHACRAFDFFISAVSVWTGRLRVFPREEVTLDVVMASACLPRVFRAVEIDGEPFWDGGYGGNPALFPFFYANDVADALLVQINPIERMETPKTARQINERMDEITFNQSLLSELRAIEFVRRLRQEGALPADRYKAVRMHRIDPDVLATELTASSKLNAEWSFLDYLHDLGRAAALDWLEDNEQHVGVRPTLDLSDMVSAKSLEAIRRGNTSRPGPHTRAAMDRHKGANRHKGVGAMVPDRAAAP